MKFLGKFYLFADTFACARVSLRAIHFESYVHPALVGAKRNKKAPCKQLARGFHLPVICRAS